MTQTFISTTTTLWLSLNSVHCQLDWKHLTPTTRKQKLQFVCVHSCMCVCVSVCVWADILYYLTVVKILDLEVLYERRNVCDRFKTRFSSCNFFVQLFEAVNVKHFHLKLDKRTQSGGHVLLVLVGRGKTWSVLQFTCPSFCQWGWGWGWRGMHYLSLRRDWQKIYAGCVWFLPSPHPG